jgi:APA family basic amino acid/polyamine antiporter
VAVLGIGVCGAMIYGLGWTNWMRLAVWLVIGLVIYFTYSTRHSRLRSAAGTSVAPAARRSEA